MEETKTCKICKGEFPKTTEHFYYNKRWDNFNPYCKPCTRAKSSKRNKENPEKYSAYQRKYNQNNREKRNIRQNKRRRENPNVRLANIVSTQIREYMHKGGGKKNNSVWNHLPYTPDGLREHLEKFWEPWMNWDNYGLGHGNWNIDHTIPQSLLPYSSYKEDNFQKCWALSNLRPMCAIKNTQKGNCVKNL